MLAGAAGVKAYLYVIYRVMLRENACADGICSNGESNRRYLVVVAKAIVAKLNQSIGLQCHCGGALNKRWHRRHEIKIIHFSALLDSDNLPVKPYS